MQIRPLRHADLGAVLALNNASVPHVNELDEAALEAITAEAALCGVTNDGHGVSGIVVTFRPGADYESANYRWFSDAYEDFLYLDRIVVAESRRGSGIGRAFYDWLWIEAAPPRITCEVNEIPPNPRSMSFHASLGFEQVGSLMHDDGKTVALLCCESATRTDLV